MPESMSNLRVPHTFQPTLRNARTTESPCCPVDPTTAIVLTMMIYVYSLSRAKEIWQLLKISNSLRAYARISKDAMFKWVIPGVMKSIYGVAIHHCLRQQHPAFQQDINLVGIH
jgi:hypothetical protein